MTLFNNRTNTVMFSGCKRHCLEHVVVFGKLIWVVEGDWDGTIIYKRTNGGGITGRVVSTSAVTDASGNSCTKIVFRTKTRLSIPEKKNFFKACRNNNTYGLNLDVLPDKTVLKFVFKQKIMIPQNFAIPVGVDPGVFPIFLNSGEYDNNYKQLASQFGVSLPRRTQRTSKLICNFSLNTVPAKQKTVTPTCTIPKLSLSGVISNEILYIQYFVVEPLPLINGEIDETSTVSLYVMNENNVLEKITSENTNFTLMLWRQYNIDNSFQYNNTQSIHTIYYIDPSDFSNPSTYIEYYTSEIFFRPLFSLVGNTWTTTTC